MVITGKLVLLDEVSPQYLELMVKWRNNPEVARFMFDQGPFTLEKQKAWYNSLINDKTRKQFIILEKKNNRPIGAINLMNIDYKNSHADWGYYIGENEFRMGGYAVEAEYLLLEYAFEVLGLNKIYCQTLASNKKVVSNHKKFGFQVDGIMRQHYCWDGEYHDLYVMSILQNEFLTKKTELNNIILLLSR